MEASLADRSVASVRTELGKHGLAADELVVPFELTPELREWLRRHRSPGLTAESQIQNMLRSLQSSKGLGLTYDRGYTGTAQEVFESRVFNCLGFSSLFVGLARELGLDAYFLRVDRLRDYGQEGSFVVASSHVTAAYGPVNRRIVLEFGAEGEQAYQTAVRLTDRQAISLYYTNRGTEVLRAGHLDEAVALLETALEIDPLSADAWLNLGVVQRRRGALESAEAAYNKALDVDPGLVSAYYNLSVLYRLRGDSHEARKVLQTVDRRSNRNPYIYLSLGDLSMRHEDLEGAQRYYRRAVQLKSDDPEIQAAMGLWALQAGNLEEAQRRHQAAVRFSDDTPRVRQLARRLEGDPPSAELSAKSS